MPKQTSRHESTVFELRTALRNCNPFYSGICTLPDYQRLLYYTCGDLRRVDFSNTSPDDLEALYRACAPAEFGRNGENVFDESYRKARKMDPLLFSTLLDLRNIGIYEQVSKALLTRSYATMDAQLYKLNVYGKGDFFKAHKDTPRRQDMFGSLVVVLPTAHEGGQFILRKDEKEWMLDFADKLATAAEPSICFVAFYGDVEHEVLPVTSGHRVTLTYNLYHKRIHSSMPSILTPSHLKLRQRLVDLVNDKSKLPNGGYLGFGLVHEYVNTGRDVIEPLLGQLKGSDRSLANVCDEVGLEYSIRLLYRNVADLGINFITTKELAVEDAEESGLFFDEPPTRLQKALNGLTIDQIEGIHFVGSFEQRDREDVYGPWLDAFHRTPITEVLEVTPMESSVNFRTEFLTEGPEMSSFHGTACMLIAVEPAESRRVIRLYSDM